MTIKKWIQFNSFAFLIFLSEQLSVFDAKTKRVCVCGCLYKLMTKAGLHSNGASVEQNFIFQPIHVVTDHWSMVTNDHFIQVPE